MTKLDHAINDLYSDAGFQKVLLADNDREAIITWLLWNDPNGCYTDEESEAEGLPQLTLDAAKAIMARQVAE